MLEGTPYADGGLKRIVLDESFNPSFRIWDADPYMSYYCCRAERGWYSYIQRIEVLAIQNVNDGTPYKL